MMILNYPSKKVLKDNIGKILNYTETSIFGPEFRANGHFVGSNKPLLTGNKGREFFAQVTMKNGFIEKVK